MRNRNTDRSTANRPHMSLFPMISVAVIVVTLLVGHKALFPYASQTPAYEYSYTDQITSSQMLQKAISSVKHFSKNEVPRIRLSRRALFFLLFTLLFIIPLLIVVF